MDAVILLLSLLTSPFQESRSSLLRFACDFHIGHSTPNSCQWLIANLFPFQFIVVMQKCPGSWHHSRGEGDSLLLLFSSWGSGHWCTLHMSFKRPKRCPMQAVAWTSQLWKKLTEQQRTFEFWLSHGNSKAVLTLIVMITAALQRRNYIIF